MARGKKKESVLTPEEKLAQALVPDWEQPYRVPDNWQYVFFNGATTRIKRGKAPKYVESSDYPVFAQKCNQKDGTICIEKAQFLNPALVDRFDDEEFLWDKDVVINSTGTGTLGRVGFYRSEYALPYKKVLPDSHITVVRPAKFVLPEYLYFFLKKAQDYLELQGVGSTNQKELRPETIGAQCFPLPPLAEQQRIVDRIEYLFAKLNEAKEKAQSVLDSFETRKAAILHKAFTGELIGKDKSEEACLESIVETIRIGPFGSALHKEDYVLNGVPVVNPKHITGQQIIPEDKVTISYEKAEELGSYKLKENDIVLGRRGEMGRSAPVAKEQAGWICGTGSMIIRLKQGYDATFYSQIIASQPVVQYLEENSVGSTLKNLNEKIVRKLPIPNFSLTEQERTIEILNSILLKEQQAEEAAEAVLEKIDLLKKSILARAFRGELGTNDPSEESALELLKQVFQEDIPAVTRKRSKSIPKELQEKLYTELENKIVKLYFKQGTDSLPAEELLSVSSKKFEIMETLRNLEQRRIFKKLPNGNYRLLE